MASNLEPNRYEKIPLAMKQERRWICYNATKKNGECKKVPISPSKSKEGFVTAMPSDPSDWVDFEKAIEFCEENGLSGIGFELYGSDFVCIDLDNRKLGEEEPMPANEFSTMGNDYVKTLNSYCEWSDSGNGVHVFILSENERIDTNNPFVKVRQGSGFVAITGKTIFSPSILSTDAKLPELIKKYPYIKKDAVDEQPTESNFGTFSDKEIIKKASNSPSTGIKFMHLMSGDYSDYASKKEAVEALCKFLAYYTNCNKEQIDRIYRTSGLFTETWDEPKGDGNHGDFYIQSAIDACIALNTERRNKAIDEKAKVLVHSYSTDMNIDDNGEPIFRVSKNSKLGRKIYTLDDTGNAERFYDYFGDFFRFDSTNGVFMFWTGKTWVVDTNQIIRKYANQLITMLRNDLTVYEEQAKQEQDENKRKRLYEVISAIEKNVKRISNKSGKDAMLSELKGIGKTSVDQTAFDTNPYLLNTNSGVVDLRTGKILPFNKDYMISRNTKVGVSFEEPTVWLKFLHDIFPMPTEKETEDIIECLRRSLGYSLTGLVKEQIMFILHGDGSNGKSTMIETLQKVMGEYGSSIDSNLLMARKNDSGVASQYSLAGQRVTRMLVSQETEKGAVLAESRIKQITGADLIEAQKKFGQPFQFRPEFKLWLMTNNFPIIRGRDYGIWRRLFVFVFNRKFKEEEKDKDMPEKLMREADRILGWIIKGAVAYLEENDLKQPECLKQVVAKIRGDFDTIEQFIATECKKEDMAVVPRKDLYKAYKAWAMDNNNGYTETETKFREEVIKKGFPIEVDKTTGIQYYKGLRLNKDTMEQINVTTYKKAPSIFED